MADGRPVRKTGKYADPRREASAGVVTAPAADGYPVTSSNGVAYWTDSTGKNWNDVGTGLREGVVYGKRFTYRNGAMHEPDGSKMAADIAPKRAGHFEWRCFGAQGCKWVWVE